MATTANKSTTVIRKKWKVKIVSLIKVEMVQKMFADQQFIRQSIQNGISFKELKGKYGYKFATV